MLRTAFIRQNICLACTYHVLGCKGTVLTVVLHALCDPHAGVLAVSLTRCLCTQVSNACKAVHDGDVATRCAVALWDAALAGDDHMANHVATVRGYPPGCTYARQT